MRKPLKAIYMDLAIALQDRSTCKRTGVGCVVASQDLETIYAIGYNGTARGFPNDDCRDEVGNCGCIHAETNAIAKVNVKDPDKVFFLTNEPCELCAKLIVNTGASLVYYHQKHIRRLPISGLDILHKAVIGTLRL